MRKTTSRIISMCLALLLALTSLASMVQPAAAQETDLQSYDVQTFYNGLAPDESEQGTIVEINQAGNLWQYGYYNDTVGYQLFNNLFYDENLWQMTQDAPSANAANWDYGDYALPGRYIYPAASYDSAVTFNAPMDGTVMIVSTGAWVGGGSEDGVRIVIYAGNTKIWPTDSEWCDINSSNSNSVTVPEITVALHKGEQLHFRINCNGNTSGDMTCWYPTITYISSEYQNQYAPGAEEPEETLPVYNVKDGYTTPSDAAESEVVSINQADNTWQFGSYSSEEGYRLFNTQYYSDGQWRMTMDSTGGANWDYGAYALDNNIYPAGSRDNAVTFTAPREGTVSVTAQDNVAWVGGATTDGVQIAVYAGDIRIWPADSEWCVIDQETNGNCATIPEIKVAVHKGDALHFRINCKGSSQNDNTCWYPVITYVSKDYQSEYAPGGSETMPVYDVKNSYPGFEVDAANSPITIDQTEKIWQFGYYNPTDGYALFDSLYYEENDWRMTKNSNGGTNWDYGRYSLEFICPSGSSDGVVTFVSPEEGTYTIDTATAWAHKDSNGGANIAIYADNTKIWPKDSDWCSLAPGVETTIPEITVALHQGDVLRFQTNCNGNAQNDNVTWYPVVRCSSKTYDETYAPKQEEGDAYPYRISATQGENGWYYLYAEVGDDLLHFQPAFINNWWWTAQDDFTTGMIRSDGLHPGDYDAILSFKAPFTGKIKISFAGNKIESLESCNGNDGIKFGVYSSSDYGTNLLYPTNGEMALVANKSSLAIEPFTVEVKKNELILFRVNRNGNAWCDMLSCVPTITYLEANKEDAGYADPFAPDTGEKEMCVPGASLTPPAYDEATAQTVTAEQFLAQLDSLSGSYSLTETLVFDSAYDGQMVDLSGTALRSTANPAVQISAKNFTLTGLSLECGGTAVQIDNTNQVRLENNIVTGAITTASSNTTLAHNTITGGVTVTGKENVLLYANVLSGQASLQSVNNSVLLKNVFSTTGTAVMVSTTNNTSIAENTFATNPGAAISLKNTNIALITGNTYQGSTAANSAICTAENCGHVYGDNIPGALDGTVHAGADESKLPADRTEIFTGMEPQTTVRYNGSEISVNAYIRQAARKQQDVVLQPGVYAVDSITFTETKNVNLYGHGVLLVFQNYTKKAIAMNGCENINVKGLTMDHAQVANAQGTVISVNGDTVVWKPDEGYGFDLLDTSRFNSDAAATAFRAGSELPYADVSFSTNRVKNSDGTYTLTGSNTLKVGDRIMFRGVFCDVNNLYNCDHITYEDVTVWNGSGFAIRELEGEGNTILNRFAVTPGPKPEGATEERLISTCDATHSTNIRHGIQVTNCLLEHMNDDGANVNGTFGSVTGFDAASKKVTFQATPVYRTTVANILCGDKIRIMTTEGKILVDTTAAQNGEGGSVILTDSFEMPSSGDVIIQNLSATGSGFLYTNCVSRNNRSRGFLIQGVNGKITQCTLENNGMAGILVSGELKSVFAECGYVDNIEISQNVIRGNGYFNSSKKECSSIAIVSDSTTMSNPDCQTHKNIIIKGNVIENRYSKYAIYVSAAQHVQLLNNTFKTRSGDLSDTATPVSVEGTTDIEVSNNVYPTGTKVKVMLSSDVVNAYGTDLGQMSSEVVSSSLISRYENGQWCVILTLKNLTESVQTGTWETVSPQEMFGTEISGTFELNSGETKSFSIPVEKTALELNEPDDFAEVTVAHCVTGRDSSYKTLQLSFAFAPKINQTITIDGNADENVWANANILAMNRKNQTSVLTGWKGTDDLGAEIKFLWDDKNLYFYAEVTDDVHSEPQTGDSIWLGDSFQTAFSPDGSSNYAEMGWALGDDGTVYSYCWTNLITGTTKGETGIIEGGICAIHRDESVKKTYYEVSIPWSFIGLNGQAPGESSNIHFAMILNDNDGSGRRGYMNIFDGIGQGKDPNKYGMLCLSGLSGTDEPVESGWYEVGDYKGDKPASQWMAPTSQGKVFAGWFTDESCTEVYTDTTGQAYAKFVNADILSVMALVSKSGTKANVRLITSVDSLKYDSVGFVVTTRGVTKTMSSTTVQSKIQTTVAGTPVTYLPVHICADSQYFMTTTIKNIPSTKFNDEIEVTPYWITLDGTRVSGASKTITVAQGLK